MKWAFVNLFLMVFWFGLGLGLFFFPDALGWERQDGRMRMFAVVAMMMGVWNMVRAWAAYSARSSARELASLDDRGPSRPTVIPKPEKPVVNPEFDFDEADPDRRRKGPPSANGDSPH